MTNERITIKGTSQGLVITLGAGLWPGLLEELDQTLGERASFFKGGRVALRVGPRQLTLPQLEATGQILDRHGVTLWAVESESSATEQAAAELGLESSLIPARPQPESSSEPASEESSLVIQRTLRSGQVLHHPGHIVIIGDVNPGAEIRAGGAVVVWGRLRGNVHAGLSNGYGDEAIVCALQLSPMQLRIGKYIARAPADDDEREIVPEMASVQDGQIVAEPWNG